MQGSEACGKNSCPLTHLLLRHLVLLLHGGHVDSRLLGCRLRKVLEVCVCKVSVQVCLQRAALRII
jgi:hypothetical protein